ncbi:hypothetical protein Nepgr_003643 [Nepenthes gracilis]|uniref:UspA domain-containing protein n=1 Tax=Nepenthes gracilis TaxID=150966 RepID=A0AAD3S014_NEPGR|nr:hypothetical protein Nepgr_003643 [Nepenthes gracilis]
MGSRRGTKFRNFCLNRIRRQARVLSSSMQNKASKISEKMDEKDAEKISCSAEEKSAARTGGRKVMVVVDGSAQAKAAMQWALSHAVQNQDIIVLLHAAKLTAKQVAGEESSKNMVPRVYELLHSMKTMCQSQRPEVNVEIALVQGKEKGPAIVEEARRQGVALLVLGQRKPSTTWRLLMMWAGSKFAAAAGGAVEHCIQNADCMAVAVRRKSKNLGGYLITTKRHKDFWLLA